MDKSSLAPYKNANKQEIIEAVERDIKKEWENFFRIFFLKET